MIAAVRRGDDRAFGELYSRYGGRIISYVFGMVGDHARAEDIAQDVFISALRRMRATERPIAFKPWIYEIAKNACIDEFRRTRRAREVPLDPDDESESPGDHLVSRGSSPDSALERRQQLDDLTGAFRGLSDNHHKILVLRELEGLSYTEIGRRLGMTRPVVESTLFRARRRLGQEYDEIASGRRCEQVQAVIETGGAKAVRALGIREHRRLARHVAHCQPCRRIAWAAGVDDSVLQPQTLAGKIAALLPIPAFLRFRRHAANGDTASASGSHSVPSVRTASQTVAQLATPGSPVVSLGRVAAAVAAAAIAGGGVVAGLGSQGSSKSHQHKPVTARSVGAPTSPLRAHANASATSGSKQGGKAPLASGSSGGKQALTGKASSSGTSASGNQSVSQSSLTPSSSSSAASGSGTTRTGLPTGSLPAPSLPTAPKLPPLGSGVPQAGVPTLPSAGSVDLNGLSQSGTSAVNSTLGLVGQQLP